MTCMSIKDVIFIKENHIEELTGFIIHNPWRFLYSSRKIEYSLGTVNVLGKKFMMLDWSSLTYLFCRSLFLLFRFLSIRSFLVSWKWFL